MKICRTGYADGQAFSTGVRRKDGHDDGDLTSATSLSAATADTVERVAIRESKLRGFGSVDSGMFRWLSGAVLVDPVSPGLERVNSDFTESGSGHHINASDIGWGAHMGNQLTQGR